MIARALVWLPRIVYCAAHVDRFIRAELCRWFLSLRKPWVLKNAAGALNEHTVARVEESLRKLEDAVRALATVSLDPRMAAFV